MNLDRTFCSGIRCTKKISCDRWDKNLEKEAKEKGIDLTYRNISMANFVDHDGVCSKYSPIVEPETIKIITPRTGKMP